MPILNIFQYFEKISNKFSVSKIPNKFLQKNFQSEKKKLTSNLKAVKSKKLAMWWGQNSDIVFSKEQIWIWNESLMRPRWRWSAWRPEWQSGRQSKGYFAQDEAVCVRFPMWTCIKAEIGNFNVKWPNAFRNHFEKFWTSLKITLTNFRSILQYFTIWQDLLFLLLGRTQVQQTFLLTKNLLKADWPTLWFY